MNEIVRPTPAVMPNWRVAALTLRKATFGSCAARSNASALTANDVAGSEMTGIAKPDGTVFGSFEIVHGIDQWKGKLFFAQLAAVVRIQHFLAAARKRAETSTAIGA